TADNGWSKTDAPLATAPLYFEQKFSAPAGAYHVWIRLRATNDSKWNDSVWLQFSDALDANGQPIDAIGSTTGLLVNLATDATATSVRGWGWQDGAYWLSQTTTIKYATSGPHTIRVQVREDGVSVDEIVVSSSRFATAAPGGPTNDSNHFVAGSSVPPSGDARSLANTSLNRFRVLGWNVAQGYNPVNRINDYNLQIDLIASFNPDVVTLEEVSVADADMPTIFAAGLSARTGRTWRSYYRPGSTIFAMILTWLPIDAYTSSTAVVSGQSFEMLHIQATVNATPVHVSTTHLYAWDAAVRANQIVALQSWLATLGPHRVAAGDYNAFPGENGTWNAAWLAEYTDAWVTATSWVQPTSDGGYTFDKRTLTGNPERID